MSDLVFSDEQLNNFERWWKEVNKRIEVEEVSGSSKLGPPPEEQTPRFKPTKWPADPNSLLNDLEKYQKLALNLGACEAKVIYAKDIPQDLRSMYIGCLNPSCRWLNTNQNCPMVRNFSFEDMKEFISDYQYAIVYKVLPPKFNTTPDVGIINLDRYYMTSPVPEKGILAKNIIRLRILAEMERRIRQVAYYDAHMMAAPMGSGPCLVTKCSDIGKCSALEKGKFCRFVDVQPIGSGCAYVDYHTLGRSLGWGVLQEGGNCAFPEQVVNPDNYYNIGLVLID